MEFKRSCGEGAASGLRGELVDYICIPMRRIRIAGIDFIVIAVGLSSLVLPVPPAAASSFPVQTQESQRAGSFTEDIMIAKFEGRVTEYSRLKVTRPALSIAPFPALHRQV